MSTVIDLSENLTVFQPSPEQVAYYGAPIVIQNASTTPALALYSNMPCCPGATLTYVKSSEEAPETMEVQLAANDSPVLCQLTSGVTVKITPNREVNDPWYARPEYFDVVPLNVNYTVDVLLADGTSQTLQVVSVSVKSTNGKTSVNLAA